MEEFTHLDESKIFLVIRKLNDGHYRIDLQLVIEYNFYP
jgi:hypothetical protein